MRGLFKWGQHVNTTSETGKHQTQTNNNQHVKPNQNQHNTQQNNEHTQTKTATRKKNKNTTNASNNKARNTPEKTLVDTQRIHKKGKQQKTTHTHKQEVFFKKKKNI